MQNVVIIGAGCAGLTAAIYTGRAELQPVLLTGTQIGGQLSETTSVENYPGFPEGVMGGDVMDKFQEQAEKYNTEVRYETVKEAELKEGGPHKLTLSNDDKLECRSLIIATGARPRWLGLESEQELRNKGVSSCATCDGALYRDVPVVVIGGGDTALEDALFLTRFASSVKVIHRRDQLRASKIMQERAFANEKLEFVWDSVVEEIMDVKKKEVTGIRVKNVKTEETTDIECKGVFLGIGHIPNTEAFKGQLKMDDAGYIILQDGGRSHSSVKGVFIAGDCADNIYRQAVTAAGMGCRAAIDAERWLGEQGQ